VSKEVILGYPTGFTQPLVKRKSYVEQHNAGMKIVWQVELENCLGILELDLMSISGYQIEN